MGRSIVWRLKGLNECWKLLHHRKDLDEVVFLLQPSVDDGCTNPPRKTARCVHLDNDRANDRVPFYLDCI